MTSDIVIARSLSRSSKPSVWQYETFGLKDEVFYYTNPFSTTGEKVKTAFALMSLMADEPPPRLYLYERHRLGEDNKLTREKLIIK